MTLLLCWEYLCLVGVFLLLFFVIATITRDFSGIQMKTNMDKLPISLQSCRIN